MTGATYLTQVAVDGPTFKFSSPMCNWSSLTKRYNVPWDIHCEKIDNIEIWKDQLEKLEYAESLSPGSQGLDAARS